MVMAGVNVVDVVATKAGVGQSGSAKQGDANQSDSDFSQVLSSLGSDEPGGNDKAATTNAAAEVAPVVEKAAAKEKDAPATDADLAANLLALCGMPVAPNMALPPAPPIISTTSSTVTSMISTTAAKTPAAMLGLNSSSAEAVKPAAQSDLNSTAAKAITPTAVAGLNTTATSSLVSADVTADAAVPTSVTDATAASPATTALNEQVANVITPLDMQWLRSNARALNAQAGSVSSALTPTANAVKDATVADLSKALLDNQGASAQGVDSQSGDVAQSNSAQGMLGQAAPMMAMLSAQGRDERLELKDVAQTNTESDVSITLNTSQLQPAGTQLASDSNGIDTSARHQLRSAVGTHQWATELGNNLTLMASKDTQSATLYMTPADLGPVQVRIETNKDQASVWFTADRAETRSALEQSLPRLREMFTAQGMSLTDAGVFGDRSRQQQPQTQPQTSFTSAGYDSTVTAEDTARVRSISLSLLDAYA